MARGAVEFKQCPGGCGGMFPIDDYSVMMINGKKRTVCHDCADQWRKAGNRLTNPKAGRKNNG